MTYETMVNTLTAYCDTYRECDGCKLKDLYDNDVNNFLERCGCAFNCMDEQMVKKIYDWYKDLDPAACKNAENECCEVEPGVDMVNHPYHYNQGNIECIDCIKSAVTNKIGIEAVCVANVIKYLFRYEEKNGIEDVKKARWYIDRLIKELENG